MLNQVQASATPGACNYGYDDDRGDYHVRERDHLAYRFEVQSVLGKGSFGQVRISFAINRSSELFPENVPSSERAS